MAERESEPPAELRAWLIDEADISPKRVDAVLEVLDNNDVDSVKDLAWWAKMPCFNESLKPVTTEKIREALARRERSLCAPPTSPSAAELQPADDGNLPGPALSGGEASLRNDAPILHRSQSTPAPTLLKRASSGTGVQIVPLMLSRVNSEKEVEALSARVQRLASISRCPELVAVARQHSRKAEHDRVVRAAEPVSLIPDWSFIHPRRELEDYPDEDYPDDPPPYYYNSLTGETTYGKPETLADGREAISDPDALITLISDSYNSVTGGTSFDMPLLSDEPPNGQSCYHQKELVQKQEKTTTPARSSIEDCPDASPWLSKRMKEEQKLVQKQEKEVACARRRLTLFGRTPKEWLYGHPSQYRKPHKGAFGDDFYSAYDDCCY